MSRVFMRLKLQLKLISSGSTIKFGHKNTQRKNVFSLATAPVLSLCRQFKYLKIWVSVWETPHSKLAPCKDRFLL